MLHFSSLPERFFDILVVFIYPIGALVTKQHPKWREYPLRWSTEKIPGRARIDKAQGVI
ncbi:MAG: hypothetical protein MJK04_36255 [Psychrosphaera sp.]|nr:hypothetical protein [Psychrosphaera sp.]